MKKILFITFACLTMTFVSCGRCSHNNACDQDTVYVDDTVVVEIVDTVYAN